jgi:hypothetical protein
MSTKEEEGKQTTDDQKKPFVSCSNARTTNNTTIRTSLIVEVKRTEMQLASLP